MPGCGRRAQEIFLEYENFEPGEPDEFFRDSDQRFTFSKDEPWHATTVAIRIPGATMCMRRCWPPCVWSSSKCYDFE
ncbi:hypothetical protein PRIPAC_85806 [Pristionchus pacificus]|uniref:Uncharacterized protein n=1 Tax=Pristionchus pacificus TaxID=54126 RepID=A0A2A6BUV9_PRIPA|nr:hypothetical protein PRIPAC_85806 [Pristionchus pacificus]|eukprot:PDM69700.1 hypothetical protein PRIPAC_44796 [Pristionchus pacificus]